MMTATNHETMNTTRESVDTSNSMDIEDLTLEEAEVVAAGIGAGELILGGIIVFGAAIIIL